MHSGVVRFNSVIARSRFSDDEAIPKIAAELPHILRRFLSSILRNRTTVLFAMTVLFSSQAYAQKSIPLASQAQTLSEYENLVRIGLQLSYIDSVFISYGQMKGLFRSLPPLPNPYGKCGSELAFEAARIKERISKPLREAVIESVASFSDSIKSPSGKFTIYYSKAGVDSASAEYVDSVAHFADEAYELEIIELGYPKPPFSSADSTWRIVLQHLGAGFYGVTNSIGNAFTSSPSGLSKYYSSITIDNSFSTGYTTTGLDAARITIFHEFHHVIQYGSYGTNLNDVAFREMMAVWLEMRSTPSVPDYLQYLPLYTLHFDGSFDHIDGIGYYGQCIWMQYLSKKFGDDILKNVWDLYSAKLPDFLLCFDSILKKENADFCSEYKRFGTAVYYTGRNFQGASIFPDARKFNSDAIQKTILQPQITDTFQALDASLHVFLCGYGKDTSVIVISRSVDRAFVSEASIASKSVLSFEAKYQFPETFCDTIILPIHIATKIFPQPYIISLSSTDQPLLNILASTKTQSPTDVSLNIYSLDNALIRHFDRSLKVNHQVIAADPFGGSWYVEWDGKDDTGRLAPSGVYYYSLKVDGIRDNGKFVVIRKN